jgi:hypothetical protein
MPTEQEDEVTRYTKIYLATRDKWIKLVLILYGFLILIMLVWFGFMEYNMIKILDTFDAWKEYKANAEKVLENSETALEQWRTKTGISDSTRTNHVTKRK